MNKQTYGCGLALGCGETFPKPSTTSVAGRSWLSLGSARSGKAFLVLQGGLDVPAPATTDPACQLKNQHVNLGHVLYVDQIAIALWLSLESARSGKHFRVLQGGLAVPAPATRERVLYSQPTGPNPLYHRDD